MSQIENIPFEIFDRISNYSDEKSYRNLMNSNLNQFHDIKWKTTKFTIKCREAIRKQYRKSVCVVDDLLFLKFFLSRVSNPKKQ